MTIKFDEPILCTRTNGKPIHPHSWGGDICVRQRPDHLEAWLNYPALGDTKIAYMTSEEGTKWTLNGARYDGENLGVFANNGVETPSVVYAPGFREGWGNYIMAILAKQEFNGNRIDRIALVHSDSPTGPWTDTGIWCHPEHPWELPWVGSNGKTQGGCQEPSLIVTGNILAMPYTAVRYEGRKGRPGTALAWLGPDSTEWSKYPDLIIKNSGQIDVHPISGGFISFYGTLYPGEPINERIEMRVSNDPVRHWSRPKTIITRDDVDCPNGHIFGPSYVPGLGLWFSSHPGRPNANKIWFMKELS